MLQDENLESVAHVALKHGVNLKQEIGRPKVRYVHVHTLAVVNRSAHPALHALMLTPCLTGSSAILPSYIL